MNIELWKNELHIFSKDSYMADDDNDIIHLWQSKNDNVVFRVGNDHELVKEDDGYGNDIYVVKKRKNNDS